MTRRRCSGAVPLRVLSCLASVLLVAGAMVAAPRFLSGARAGRLVTWLLPETRGKELEETSAV